MSPATVGSQQSWPGPVIPEVRARARQSRSLGARPACSHPVAAWPEGGWQVSGRIQGLSREEEGEPGRVLSSIQELSLLLLPQHQSCALSERPLAGRKGAAQVTRSPGLQVSRPRGTFLPSQEAGRAAAALCALAPSLPPAAPTTCQGYFLAVALLRSNDPGNKTAQGLGRHHGGVAPGAMCRLQRWEPPGLGEGERGAHISVPLPAILAGAGSRRPWAARLSLPGASLTPLSPTCPFPHLASPLSTGARPWPRFTHPSPQQGKLRLQRQWEEHPRPEYVKAGRPHWHWGDRAPCHRAARRIQISSRPTLSLSV